jgi:hypothetical protein
MNDDDPEGLILRGSRPENKNCRWWASWILIFAFLPIVILYSVWLPLTCSGRIWEEGAVSGSTRTNNMEIHSPGIDTSNTTTDTCNEICDSHMNHDRTRLRLHIHDSDDNSINSSAGLIAAAANMHPMITMTMVVLTMMKRGTGGTALISKMIVELRKGKKVI